MRLVENLSNHPPPYAKCIKLITKLADGGKGGVSKFIH